MTDLISLSDIENQLREKAQTWIGIDDAFAVVEQAHNTYEADRTESKTNIDTLTGQVQDQAGTIADLETDKVTLTDKVENLTAQVDTLTQSNDQKATTLAENATTIATQAATVTDLQGQVSTLKAQITDLSPDVTVTIDSSVSRISNFSTAVSHVSTNDLMVGNATARARAEAALAPALVFHRVSVHSYGASDPWPWDGTGTRPPEPTNWTTLNNLLAMVARMGGIPILGFGNWCWHMKGRWDGKTTVPIAYSPTEQFTDDGRPITEQLPSVLKLVQRTCERYMAAPYNVRYWQLGGWEFHGFERGRDGTFNQWGFDNYPGSPGQADMGMAFLHNQVSAKIIEVATALSIPRNQIKIITNYPPMVAYSKASGVTVPVGHPLYGKPWGAPDKRTIAALLGMLPLLTPGSWDYWSYDQTSRNKDIIASTDDWTNSQRFSDMAEYLKSQVAALGFGNMPFIVSEEYNKPQADPGPNQFQLRAALHTEAFRRFVWAGASMAIVWSTVGRANEPGAEAEAGLHSSVATATGGQPQPALAALKIIHDTFPPNTVCYPLLCSDKRIDGLASDASVLMYNRSADSLSVALGGDSYLMPAYAVRKVTR